MDALERGPSHTRAAHSGLSTVGVAVEIVDIDGNASEKNACLLP